MVTVIPPKTVTHDLIQELPHPRYIYPLNIKIRLDIPLIIVYAKSWDRDDKSKTPGLLLVTDLSMCPTYTCVRKGLLPPKVLEYISKYKVWPQDHIFSIEMSPKQHQDLSDEFERISPQDPIFARMNFDIRVKNKTAIDGLTNSLRICDRFNINEVMSGVEREFVNLLDRYEKLRGRLELEQVVEYFNLRGFIKRNGGLKEEIENISQFPEFNEERDMGETQFIDLTDEEEEEGEEEKEEKEGEGGGRKEVVELNIESQIGELNNSCDSDSDIDVSASNLTESEIFTAPPPNSFVEQRSAPAPKEATPPSVPTSPLNNTSVYDGLSPRLFEKINTVNKLNQWSKKKTSHTGHQLVNFGPVKLVGMLPFKPFTIRPYRRTLQFAPFRIILEDDNKDTIFVEISNDEEVCHFFNLIEIEDVFEQDRVEKMYNDITRLLDKNSKVQLRLKLQTRQLIGRYQMHYWTFHSTLEEILSS
ncbi:hypothetical protein KGF56_003005 [Candida oxycetoniae]|uniref:Uncharacterized protein n=1 Tax=Candida oxycetoniae TaxID=497107 RepID=A0AAI9WXQ4_9ASCO|nr:uncharacterized protein KGF56_003005 [Candida oxycetoniae]KAI3404244.2 hypothetical protein KGF56_003005 [Candida oxycetoniae]